MTYLIDLISIIFKDVQDGSARVRKSKLVYTFLMVTYDTVREMALALPGVEEGTSYGTPALKVRGKLFVRLKEDGETIVLKTTYEEREELMAHDPETYFITDHYLNYPYILVSLARVNEDALKELILTSYRLAKPGQNR